MLQTKEEGKEVEQAENQVADEIEMKEKGEVKSVQEQAILGIIDQIWTKYDDDNNNCLDKEETKKFVQEIIGMVDSEDQFDDANFNEIFTIVDIDSSGTIEREEMVEFIQQILRHGQTTA